MRLRTSVRLGLILSVGTIAALGAFTGWSVRDLRRARDVAALGIALQQENLERALVRDEYLLHGADRARQQWERRTADFEAALARAAGRLDEPWQRELLVDLRRDVGNSKALFDELVRLGATAPPPRAPTAPAEALREQLWSALLVIQHDQAARVGLLTGAHDVRAEAPAAERRVLLVVFGTFALALAVVAANGVATARLVQRRLVRLRDGAERIAAGDLGHRIAIRGDDELADLGRAFDAMAARLERQVHELEASNRELESFSYSISHDLRAPLRYITGFVDILEEEAPHALDENGRRYLRVIADSARKMGRLIDDLLAFSRLGRSPMASTVVALGPLVDSVIQEVAREAEGREVAWEVGPLPGVRGDGAMLRQVWVNLLGNALKFTRPRRPARIQVGAVAAGAGEVHCFVRDNGVGFDMQYADKLFGVFQRLHGEREFEGNGVGLANVQRIVHRHGGRCWADAKPGEGATFWFSLPGAEGGAGEGGGAAAPAAAAPAT